MSTFEKAGRFDESLCSSTDRDLMIRFLQHFHIDSIALIPDLSVLHYADSDLTVTNLKDNKHRGLDRFYEKFIILYSFEVLQQSLKRAEEYFGYPNRKQIEKLYRQNKTILVTGVCGFIGSSLAKELVNYDYVVYGVDNLSSGSIDRIKLLQTRDNFHFIECDLSDDNQVTHLFEESSYDFVYHLAALPRVNFSFEFPEESYRANVIATAQLVNALKTHNVQRFIFTSSSSVYGMQQQVMMNEGLPINPLSPYALQKAESENTIDKILSESETDCIILRLFNVYGYNSIETNSYSTLIHKWISEMTKRITPVIYGNGRQSRDFTYLDDVITALRNCVENYKKETNPTIINIGCSENISIGEAYNKLATLLNYKKMPHYKEVLYPEPAYTRADNKKAAECLGWTPSIFFEEGLEKTVSSFKRKQKIVIGMPLHNGASTIRRAVNSFLNQKDIKRDICLVIINDSSTDNWQSEIEDLLCDSIIIENVNFRSVFSTRNYINRYILQHFPQACMIGRLDADDEFAHEKVLHEVEKIIDSENPDIILAGNLLRCNDEILERKNCPTSEMTEKNVLLQRLKLMSEGISHAELPSCNTLIKPQYILEYPERTSAEDHWLTVEYILNKDKYHIHVAENLIYAIYSLSGNLTAQNRKEDEYFKSRRELYDYAYSKVNGDVGQEN